MKHFFLMLLFSVLALNLQAQEDRFGWQVIDTSRFVCQYDFLYPGLGVSNRDDMRLEIGKRVSKFYSQMTLEYFILRSTPEGNAKLKAITSDVFKRQSQAKSVEEGDRIMSELPGRKSDMIVYKNYPKDSIYVQDATSGTEFVYYTEPYVGQDWTILPDTTTHLGYHCQKATCTWRGRNYEAWFTSEIPVNDGPMKFFGLPGLIVKISDTNNAYTLTLKGVEKSDKPIYFNTRTFLKNSPTFEPITRCELLLKQSQSFKNILRVLKRDLTQLGKSTEGLDENKFDTMERDCK